jgi:hypothetical protein
MSASSERTRTKADMRAEAIQRFKVSKKTRLMQLGFGRLKKLGTTTGMTRYRDQRRRLGERYSSNL